MPVFREDYTPTELALERIADALEKLVELNTHPDFHPKKPEFFYKMPVISFNTEGTGGGQE